MINLGDKVRDKVTGFVGIAVCRSTYLNGCDRIAVQAPAKKNEKPLGWVYFDEPQLEVTRSKAIKRGSKKTGGYKPDNAQK